MISMDSLCLQHARMPRAQDLVIFVPITTDGQTDFAHVQGKYYVIVFMQVFHGD